MPKSPSHRQVNILVVEDEPDDRTLIQSAFKKVAPDSRTHLVTNGSEAIAYLMGEGEYANRATYPYPNFIVTDLKMPVLDGFAILEHLKGNPTWAVIPVVVLSASSDPDDTRTAYMLGASSYHVKPTSFEALCSQLKVLHDYWMTCQIPEVDTSGRQVRTLSKGKLGQRFPQPPERKQTRAEH